MKRAGNKIMGNDSKVNYLHDILWEWKINYFFAATWHTFWVQTEKTKKSTPKKIPYISGNGTL